MNNDRLKAKLQIFEQRGAYWVLLDLLKKFDGNRREDCEYQLFIDKLEQDYKRELKTPPLCKQIDLEDSIREINGEL